MIVKAEHASRGANPRYIVTSLKGAPQWLYDRVYCARGDMENRIKEQQLDLFADRTSCHAWWPNQYRLPLSTLAYVLLEAIRRIALAGGELANAHVGTIRLKLLKIGTVVLRNARPAFHLGGPGPGTRSSPIHRSLPHAGKTARKSWPRLWKPYWTVRFPVGWNHQARTGLENRGFGGESTHSRNIRARATPPTTVSPAPESSSSPAVSVKVTTAW